MRYLIKFSYDGTKFHGFQRQNDVKNVQKTLEDALSKILDTEIVLKGSGRTDAGVHALGQCAHFDCDGKFTSKEVYELNKILNNEIVIKNCKKVGNNFHARHSVKKKTYVYKINNGKYRKDYEGYYFQCRYPLDIRKMRKASKLFIGVHDFHNFVSGFRVDYTTCIYKVNIKKHGDIVLMIFVGAGFYRYMVRHLVGALLDVGRGKVDINVIENMLLNGNLNKKLSIVPADGLYLEKIEFDKCY